LSSDLDDWALFDADGEVVSYLWVASCSLYLFTTTTELIMTNTIDQNINDYCIDTFYFMDNKAIPGDRSEPLYRTLSWIEDDNECTYWSLTNHNHHHYYVYHHRP
jgi:hypothetical protein